MHDDPHGPKQYDLAPECEYCKTNAGMVRHADDPEFVSCQLCGTTMVDADELYVEIKKGLDLNDSIEKAVKEKRGDTGASSNGNRFSVPILGDAVPEDSSARYSFYDD